MQTGAAALACLLCHSVCPQRSQGSRLACEAHQDLFLPFPLAHHHRLTTAPELLELLHCTAVSQPFTVGETQGVLEQSRVTSLALTHGLTSPVLGAGRISVWA